MAYDLAVLILDTYPREMLVHIHKDRSEDSPRVVFVKMKNWKKSACQIIRVVDKV